MTQQQNMSAAASLSARACAQLLRPGRRPVPYQRLPPALALLLRGPDHAAGRAAAGASPLQRHAGADAPSSRGMTCCCAQFFNDIVGLLGALGFWPLTIFFPTQARWWHAAQLA